jgi:hypothetical protein
MVQKQAYDLGLFRARRRGTRASSSGVLNRQVQRRGSSLVLADGIGPVREQRAHRRGATRSYGAMQRGDAALVRRIRIRARTDQDLHDGSLRLGVPPRGARSSVFFSIYITLRFALKAASTAWTTSSRFGERTPYGGRIVDPRATTAYEQAFHALRSKESCGKRLLCSPRSTSGRVGRFVVFLQERKRTPR